MRGRFDHVIDEKGRMFIPSKFRAELGCRAVLSRGLHNCLVVYPLAEWEAFEAKIKALPTQQAEILTRFFVNEAQDVELDGQGRILVPQYLRNYAGIDKNVVVVGDVNFLKIWDAQRYTDGDPTIDNVAATMQEFGI